MSCVIKGEMTHIVCDRCGGTIVVINDILPDIDPFEKDFCIDCEIDMMEEKDSYQGA